ncbi:N-acetylmuramoyl-L-alanine amidase family protein [Rummeliibacillus pycnus]|uniref:N-acetylmuramoyl-L-alanine amidase family protein n=1 Tax=Rummeliibacillus pycnus TaxID=101070 RepID=UPI003D2D4967
MKKKWLIAIDAGHGKFTRGKQSPDGEREWNFNNKVVQSIVSELNKQPLVQYVRVDDQTGKTDRSLADRVQIANRKKADLYISVHHNANNGKWGNWSGVETFVMTPKENNLKSTQLAELIHPKVVTAMSLKDRGIKESNFYVLRETEMPAILIEGGFMDSLIDIKRLRDNQRLSKQGIAIAQGIIQYISFVNSLLKK